MSTVKESISSPTFTSGDKKSASREYIVTGTADADTALELVDGAAPKSFSVAGVTVYKTSVDVSPESTNIWTGSVEYSEKDKDPDDSEEDQNDNGWGGSISFDTAGGTGNVTTSLKTTSSGYNSEVLKATPNFNGLINVSGKDVKGIDLVQPGLKFSESHEMPFEKITTEYARQIASITGSVNSGSFRGFDAGEVLFTGCSGSTKSAELYTLSFSFICHANADALEVGPFSGINKKGHEYLWVFYTDTDDAESESLVKTPAAYYVEQVYPEADFASLGIG